MGSRALLKAVSAGRPRQVRLLLDSGVDPNDTDDLGQTPVISSHLYRTSKNREKIVRMLLKRGGVVSQADVVGRSALLWACLYGREAEVSLLLEYADLDLDLNRSDINGQTALFHAASSGNAASVKLMVGAMMKYELSVDVPDHCGITPLMQTVRLGYDICSSILIHHGKARTGLRAKYPEDFIKAEMWAVKAHCKRETEVRNVTAFPPILSQASKN
ncbi:LOW QUALITY PROTEIN: protein TANC1-like [Liolophura sinensis]|uniref:LOW QUALITY PROTEIN: protein TANC1-like n=1 Tax=Liolophura sinensis TaxID=3198878 RepID=UPI003159619D